MARAIWTGAITFGLVSIPVGLFTATQDHTVHFHQFQRGTSDRVRNQRVNERTGEQVDRDEIVKGADVGGGEHVVVDPAELDEIAPGRSQSLEISDFVDLAEIDPLYFGRTYWLAPTGDGDAGPYALLLAAMTGTNRAGIGTFVMRGKEYLAAIRPDRDVLALETLHFADEVRDPRAELEHLPEPRRGTRDDRELDMATRLIESMSVPWEPEQYHDSYRDRVEQLIEDKRRGREVVAEAAPPEPTEMSDLLEALQRSVDAARDGGRKNDGRSRSARSSAAGRHHNANGAHTADDGAGTDPGSATKAELQRMARDLDVRGRSSMNRDELADAVRRAS
ncbi:DNA end-binding protein Ku [Pseudonocardia ammonioxydans]|uniref:Non-homologous end joining protein Ku n=1 Tax=Pseudonocardia ammonioxydans TaxID=260086 RepID=A0A1I4UCR7_PSUAM|nr:Ku protein [Pseudonocardia ammonioxydans]SFM86705.1 DNA end-binding protein Ku [Pseudonocardia ammonioxydans]